MPNHVSSKCTVTGPIEDVTRFYADLFTPTEPKANDEESGLFDFNKIIPMPEILRGTVSGSYASMGYAYLTRKDTNKYFPRPIEEIIKRVEESPYKDKIIAEGQKALEAEIATGYRDWYDWSNANWGTKWGSYSVNVIDSAKEDGDRGNFQFTFDTAWSFPTPIFDKLTETYPALTFYCVCFDEGWGFAGKGELGADSEGEPFEFLDDLDRRRNSVRELYREVYGDYPEPDEDEEEEGEED